MYLNFDKRFFFSKLLHAWNINASQVTGLPWPGGYLDLFVLSNIFHVGGNIKPFAEENILIFENFYRR